MESLIFDTETTGLTKPSFSEIENQPHIIELAVLIVDEKGEIVDTFDSLIKPPIPLDPEVTKMNGIKNEDLLLHLPFKEHINRLRQMWYRCQRIFGHNVTFDTNLMKYELQRAECDYFPWPDISIDTVHEFYHMFGYRPKLSQLYQKILGEEMVEKHRAMVDAMAVHRILKKAGFYNV